jgi:hypothetical protein
VDLRDYLKSLLGVEVDLITKNAAMSRKKFWEQITDESICLLATLLIKIKFTILLKFLNRWIKNWLTYLNIQKKASEMEWQEHSAVWMLFVSMKIIRLLKLLSLVPELISLFIRKKQMN